MKVLFVFRPLFGKIIPFIKEQKDALVIDGVTVEDFVIEGKGWYSYLKSYRGIVITQITSPLQFRHPEK